MPRAADLDRIDQHRPTPSSHFGPNAPAVRLAPQRPVMLPRRMLRRASAAVDNGSDRQASDASPDRQFGSARLPVAGPWAPDHRAA